MAPRSHIKYQQALPHADGFELGGATYLASSPGHRGGGGGGGGGVCVCVCVAWGRGYVSCATPSPLVPDSCVCRVGGGGEKEWVETVSGPTLVDTISLTNVLSLCSICLCLVWSPKTEQWRATKPIPPSIMMS